ncbi:TetR/AcrR family transcriptional regulator [Streptomyces sp. HC44]|uniref:TetR/AcrR family transcriptional regulator n=1 Tax=Streptomyces scabichelini TaxID=2711217 RepID=A0A6G4UZB4_9ACTN|nr:TetR/AcrR family transcriptional regulator [Streptomyces scabichelini]NGO07015.1 TetR/AcrR family transcriptional regulator [Streptomyces scabichelini]
MRRTAAAAAETREAVMNAALEVFAEKGWAATTLDEVARRAGVTRGAVYHHGHDKRSLLVSVLKENWRTVMEPAWERLTDRSTPPRDRLTGFLAAFLRLLSEDARFRALVTVTVSVAPQLPTADSDLTDKQATIGAWRDDLRSVAAEIGDPLPSGLRPDDVAYALLTVLYGATTLASGRELPGAAAGAATPDLAAAIVHGLTDETNSSPTAVL